MNMVLYIKQSAIEFIPPNKALTCAARARLIGNA